MLEFIYISSFYGILSQVHCLKLQILLGAVAYAFKTSAWGKKQVVFEFEASQGYTERPCLKTNYTFSKF